MTEPTCLIFPRMLPGILAQETSPTMRIGGREVSGGLDSMVAVSQVILSAQWLLWRSNPNTFNLFNFQALDSINTGGITMGIQA